MSLHGIQREASVEAISTNLISVTRISFLNEIDQPCKAIDEHIVKERSSRSITNLICNCFEFRIETSSSDKT